MEIKLKVSLQSQVTDPGSDLVSHSYVSGGGETATLSRLNYGE